MLPPPPAPAEPVAELPAAAEPVEVGTAGEAAPAGTRENGFRSGVRFRRGSRGTLRAGEIPLIGMVQVETPEVQPAADATPPEAAAEPAPAKKSPRPRRAPRKKAAAAATAEGPAPEAAETEAPAKRPRPRARKKST